MNFDKRCRYDNILGRYFLTKSGIDILYSTGTMKWFQTILPAMREGHKLANSEYLAMADVNILQTEEEE